ncbi:glucosaminidase domain-containing protein [Jeotgalibaca caeni]|uniref:glucosaminidase domain-containing protein n=1 Tax=Jeotgalibaca caeni TaxID=3028623 RepID=UPI00237EA54C|nr:glucosaminidase domain-containing protein [Jeotgalibaca caeni]MDE1548165.1 glucosaminidase domain-containing protein [Jeotgalibaca caeni]
MKRKKHLIPMKILFATSTLFASSISPVFATEELIVNPTEVEKTEEIPSSEEIPAIIEENVESGDEIPVEEESSIEEPVVEESTEEIIESDESVEEEPVEQVVEEEVKESQPEPAAEEETEAIEEEVQEETPAEVQEELPDLPEYNRSEIHELAMQMMEEDLQSKNSSARMMRAFSTGIPHVDDFISKISPYAVEDSVTSGILPSITIAQGALESAWGLSGLALDANNLFGIKASTDWKGKVYNVITREYADPVKDKNGKVIKEGYWYNVVAPFRHYNNWLESIRDHGNFFTGTEWRRNNYRHVIGEKDYRKAAQALQDAGYATDPSYANKLISIIETYQLNKYDQVPVLSAEYHVQKHGWLKTSGTRLSLGHVGDDLRVEDLRFRFPDNNNISINFSAHIQKKGWVNNIKEGSNAGNVGNGWRMEAVKLNLTGEGAKSYDIYYRVYSDTIGWSGWAKNGAPAGTEGYGKKIRSIEVIISWKDEVPVNTSGKSFSTYSTPIVNYATQLQYDGWTSPVKDGQLSGTVGKGRRLESLQVSLSNAPYTGGIEYQSHAQTYGWLPKVSNGMTSGTVGEGKRLEAIKVNLTGTMAQEFDIYYRTHIQTYGWTGWAKNGAPSGSEGLGRRMEALQIRIVKKGSRAPGSTSNSFYR